MAKLPKWGDDDAALAMWIGEHICSTLHGQPLSN